jgi:biuret amidohydrolase
MGMFQFRMAMAWQRTDSPEQVDPWFLRDAPGFQIAPELNPSPSEGVFDKLTMSAFEGTWLDFALRDCGINAFYRRRRRDRDRDRTDSAARS